AAADGQAADAVELALVDPVGVGEAVVGQRGLHGVGEAGDGALAQERALVGLERCERVGVGHGCIVERRADFRPPAYPTSLAPSSTARLESTDSGSVETGLRRASAPWSRRLMSSHCCWWPSLRVRWSRKPPRSLWPCRSTTTCPRASASSIGSSLV